MQHAASCERGLSYRGKFLHRWNRGRGSHGGRGVGVKCYLKTSESSARVKPVSEMAMIFGLSIKVSTSLFLNF